MNLRTTLIVFLCFCATTVLRAERVDMLNIIAPQPVGDLKYVKASYETLYGTINVDWTCENGTFTLNVSVPVNTTAVVYLPGEKEPKEIQSGTYQLVCAK